MKLKNILANFVKECSKKLKLKGIIQFGSSTYSKNFFDIDLLFIFNDQIIKINHILKLRELIKEFEKKHKEIVFDFGGIGTRERCASYSISIILFSLKDLHTSHPENLFFLKTVQLDKNIKVLYGENPIKDFKIPLTSKNLFDMLSVNLIHTLRKNLDDKIDYESLYRLFKTSLRAMLINEGFFKKEELLEKFNFKFNNQIKLPANASDILSHKIKDEDFKDILNFVESCLEYLSK